MSKFVSIGIFLAIAAGITVPLGVNIAFVIPFLLAAMLFFSFLELNFNVRRFAKKELFFYLFVVLGIAPFLFFEFSSGMESSLRIGIFIILISPPAISAPVVARLVRGDKELIVSNVFVYNLLSPLTYPIILSIYFKSIGTSISSALIFAKIASIIFIPLLLSIIFIKLGLKKKVSPNFIEKFSSISFILVVWIAVSSSSPYLRGMEPISLLTAFAIVLFLSGLLFAAGFALPKNKELKKSLSISFGHKNSTLAIWIALSNFQPYSAAPIVLYVICHTLINGILISRFSRT